MGANVRAEEPRLDFDKLWNFQKPAETEQKFRDLVPYAQTQGRSYYLQLLTQLARTQSLQENYAAAYDILADVLPRLAPELRVAKVRYLLELGRTQNGEKKAELARQTFQEAFNAADEASEWGYAVDALHMVAITFSYGAEKSAEQKLSWEAKAVAYAEEKDSTYAKKWLGSLYFNTGWSYYELERFPEALATFEKAFNLDQRDGSPNWILLDDRRTIAQLKRRLGRGDEALAEQLQLEKENMEKLGKPDGLVFEELGELYLAKNDAAKAHDYFAQAYPLLLNVLKDPKYQERLARIKRLGGL